MARSSIDDPIEKFRFRITVISIDLSVTGTLESIAGLSGQGTFAKNSIAILSRSGFSQIKLPKANIKTIKYRENLDNFRFQKIPGLVNYDPIVLSRGVTQNRNLYDWYRLVHEEMALLSVATEVTSNSRFIPKQSNNFRKDVIIESLNRTGEPIKGWYLFNAFPTSYSPGNDLDAGSDEKLIESLVLDYEFFLELEGGLEGFTKEMLKGAAIIGAGALQDQLQDKLGI